MTAPLPDFLLEPLVRAALMEDLTPMGDVTTRAVVPAGLRYTARLNAREAGVVSGMQIAALAFRLVDPALKVETCVAAVDAGVEAAVILDGRIPHAMLLEIFTARGAGTLIHR